MDVMGCYSHKDKYLGSPVMVMLCAKVLLSLQGCYGCWGPSINYVTQKGEGGMAKHNHWILFLFKSIRILTESVTWGRGVKIANFCVT